MTDRYPPPRGAAMVWASSDTIFIRMEDAHGSHTAHVSNDVYGMKCLLSILRERARDPEPTVGRASAPVQYDLDAVYERLKARNAETEPVALSPRNAVPRIDLSLLRRK